MGTDTGHVLAANQAFYDAHEARDLRAMGEVWEHSARAVCVHPGWPVLRGWDMVEESWRRIFSGPGRSQFILTDVHVEVAREFAWVTLDENLVDTGGALGGGGPVVGGSIAATNAFARDPDGGWRLVIHHGSPIAM